VFEISGGVVVWETVMAIKSIQEGFESFTTVRPRKRAQMLNP
jgi:hypothetical protein